MSDSRILTYVRTLFENRPFSCPYDNCYYFAKRNDHLEVHMRQHSGELPFECDICKEKFMQKSQLDSHRAKHSQIT
jgi:uncharacterized Zn-finger protein